MTVYQQYYIPESNKIFTQYNLNNEYIILYNEYQINFFRLDQEFTKENL